MVSNESAQLIPYKTLSCFKVFAGATELRWPLGGNTFEIIHHSMYQNVAEGKFMFL